MQNANEAYMHTAYACPADIIFCGLLIKLKGADKYHIGENETAYVT